ncbi:T9SS type B sorting domain-containing protein [Flavobacterium sp. GT3R68]|uniref:T9SS type B sorting domain-containing protein n=1 Tax=Flavobacterium sp. GT3R68 TaxID=2594437 RepID=UPI000F893B15|nr:T9SS type B sorting domain-containing protein [Flavobacterium sp. GT3R68]RTY92418.1 T9SS type B sorting domain-containing protein [Flavobacterium sp. GSN2]TRW92334.1 T9SS type B sorting domain-containing protein [Flavobacterium sp. GT3R68]
MKIKYILFLLFLSTSAFCQGEASNWYFGQHAGISFSSGSPVTLTDMPMTSNNLRTNEGCTSISDSNGNLLFYTDGTKVWDRNHEVMFNGNDLHGDSSSSQSAIIVPKPDSQTKYYIFTVDRLGTNFHYGLQYSEVDMTLNDGFGDVTTKNIRLLDECSEKITAVKSFDCAEIWVITYSSPGGFTEGNYNTFFSYKITPAGVQTVPVVSSTPLGGIDDPRGYLKVSADGTKIAIAHQAQIGNSLFLYNFNKQTGAVTNQQKLIMSDPTHPNNKLNTQPYGIEFSLSTNKLYVTSSTPELQTYLWQFDLQAANAVKLISYQGSNSYRGALQMAPDGKIYRALCEEYTVGSRYLGVINNPEAAGIACNYQHNAIDLDPNNEGRRSMQGLPPFIQSLFLTKIDIIAPGSAGLDNDLDLCYGDTYRLNGPVIAGATYSWYVNGVLKTPYNINYLDVDIDVSSLVIYKLLIDKNDGSCPIEGQASVTYYPLPTVNSPVTLKQCDTDTDGISDFDLTEKNNFISANSANETFTYYTTPTAANAETNAIPNPTAYSSSNSTVWVRVENANGCFRTAQLDLVVSATQVPTTFHPMLYKCDDYLDSEGNDTANNDDRDGIATFDMSTVATSIIGILPPQNITPYTIKFYKNEADFSAEINEITNIDNYRNIGYPNMQLIWVRVDSTVDNGCYGFANVTLTVEALPTAYPVTIGRECDDNQDGKFPFNTSSILPTLLNGQTNVTVTYFNQNNTIIPTGGSNQLPNPFNTASQTITIRVSNNNTSVSSGPCYDETTLEFIVDALPLANTVVIPAECEDDLDPATADGLYPFDTTTIESNILGSLTGMNVSYFDQNGNQLPRPLPNPFLTGTQDITVTVENPLNATCTLPPTVLRFVVNPLPNIALVHRELVCSHQSTFSTILDAGILDNTPASAYTYQWYYEGNILASKTNPTLTVTAEGIYTVNVTTNMGCSRTRTITVVHSSGATFSIQSVDLSDNNTITVTLTADSLGDYVYSLNHQNAYQTSNVFTNVAPGIYTVYVKDLNGCYNDPQIAYVIGAPPYFTPNGDGINDTWNVKGVSALYNYNSTIYIFDRYGKLIKQLGTTGEGWNGTFNGQLMPSTDYWYAIYLEDGRVMKGHFALKR